MLPWRVMVYYRARTISGAGSGIKYFNAPSSNGVLWIGHDASKGVIATHCVPLLAQGLITAGPPSENCYAGTFVPLERV